MAYGFHIQFLYLIEQSEGSRVDSNDIRGNNHGFQCSYVGSAFTLRSVLMHHTVSIHNVQYRFLLPGADVGDTLLQVVLMEETAVPDDTHIVLHGTRQFRSAVVLQDRHINPRIRFNQRFMYLCRLYFYPVGDGYFFKVLLIVGGHDDTSGFFDGASDATAFVTFLPVVAGMVENSHFFSSGFQALLYQCLD